MSEIVSAFPHNTTFYHSVISLSNKELCIWSQTTLIMVAIVFVIYCLYYMYVLHGRKTRYSRLPVIAV